MTRRMVGCVEVIEEGGRNPLLVIPGSALLAWLREHADKAEFADRASSAIQFRFDGSLVQQLPDDVTFMVSNIPGSRE